MSSSSQSSKTRILEALNRDVGANFDSKGYPHSNLPKERLRETSPRDEVELRTVIDLAVQHVDNEGRDRTPLDVSRRGRGTERKPVQSELPVVAA